MESINLHTTHAKGFLQFEIPFPLLTFNSPLSTMFANYGFPGLETEERNDVRNDLRFFRKYGKHEYFTNVPI